MKKPKPTYSELLSLLNQAEEKIKAYQQLQSDAYKAEKDTSSMSLETSETDLLQTIGWKMVFNALNDAVILLDAQQRIMWVNQRAEHLIGVPVKRMKGKHWREVFLEFVQAFSEYPFQLMQETLKPQTTLFQLHNRYYEITVDPIFDKDNQFQGSVHVIADITKRWIAEQQLAESENKFRTLVESSNDGISLLDPKGIILFANQRKAKLLGYSNADELVGMNAFSLLPDQERIKFEQLAGVFQNAGCLNNIETYLIRKDGSLLPAEITLRKVYSSSGDCVYIMDTLRDISERKRAEAKLRQSEETYRNLFHNAQVGLFRTRISDGKILESNEALARMFGFESREDFISNFATVSHYVDPGTREHLLEILKRDGYVKNFEARFFRKDWSIFWARYSARIYPEQGWIEGVAEDITEMRVALAALRENEEKYRHIAENISDVVFTTDLDLNIRFLSPSIKKLIGITSEEYLQLELEKRYPLSSIQKFKKLLSEELERDNEPEVDKNRAVIIDTEHLKPDGSSIVISMHISFLRNEQGVPTGLLGVARDITSWVDSQEKIKITKDTYHSIFNSVSEAIFVIDEQNQFIDVNRSAERMYGYKHDEFIGKTPASLAANGLNDLANIEEIHRQVRINGITQNFEFWAVRKNGEIFPKEVFINRGMYFGKDCIIATARDITKRKKLEKTHEIIQLIARAALSETDTGKLLEIIRNELSNIIDTTNFFVAVYDAKTEMFRQLVFHDEKDSFEYWTARHTFSGQVICQNNTIMLRGNEIEDFKLKHNLKIYGSLPACWLGVPIRSQHNVVGVVVIQHYTNPNAYTPADINLLEMVAHELGIFFDRVKMLNELVAAKEKAEESDRLKTAFLQNLSHEIRTPLNGIIGFASLLNDPELSAEERNNYADIIIERSWQLTSIINDILTISSIETRQEQIFNEIFDVNDLLAHLHTVFEPQAREKGIRLIYHCELPLQKNLMIADKTKIGQVFNNLLSNALKFTSQGEIEFGCRLKDTIVEFFVKDTGIGIDPSKHQKIFDRFVQADETIRSDYGGTGLGLAICKGFVSLMGGDIWVLSHPGEGSVFYFTIPYIQAPEPHKTLSEETPANENNRQITVLIAEDEDSNYLLLDVLLKRLGCKAVRAKNGSEALEICRTTPVDLVLMDIRMPVMNGYEAAKAIRQFMPHMPIIAQTAHAVQSEIEEFKDAFDDYITKPFSLEKIKAVVTTFTENKEKY